MRKFMTALSFAMSIGFAVALANAEDTTPSTTKDTTKSSDSMLQTAKNAKSCTDENGVTYKHGEKGFQDCLQSMNKTKHEQMGGQAGSTDSDTSSSTTTTETSSS